MAMTLRTLSEDDIGSTRHTKPIMRLVKMQLVKPEVLPTESELFREMVAVRAFLRAEQRGFEAGHDLEDWLEAEQELLGNWIITCSGKTSITPTTI